MNHPSIIHTPTIPPRPFSIAVRLTRKYVTGWSHLDIHHELGEATLVAMKPARWDTHGESYRQLQLVRVPPSPYRVRNIIRAIHDTMQHGCTCEHDCCGHIQTHVSKVRPLCPGLFAVTVRGCRNI
jgi:hypothetical protein